MFVQVTCTAFEGDFPISFTWELNGKPIDGYLDISISAVGKRSSYLSIDSVSYEHAGNYTCCARNNGGETSSTAELQVNGYYLCLLISCSFRVPQPIRIFTSSLPYLPVQQRDRRARLLK